MKVPRRVTDLGRTDFEEIARATNPIPGLGMSIERTDNGFRFSIDETQFKRMLWAFNANGGFAASAADVEGISLDPPS